MIRYRYLIIFVIFSLLVLGKFHGSSIGMWDDILIEKTNSYKQVNILGKSRAIRSDEWSLGTPWYLAQAMSKEYYPFINKNIRSDGQNMMLVNYYPVFDISLVGKPANWGFFLFGKERGFSWWWFSRLFLLLLSSFELAMILSRGNKPFSGICALWIAFSPAVQWWYSTHIIDILYYSQFIIVAVYKYINVPVKRSRAFLSVGIALCSIGFILSLYPKFQVPTAYLIVFFAACFLYENKTNLQLGKAEFWQVSLGALVVFCVVASVLMRSSDAINLLSNTVYPGKRFTAGGFESFFSSFVYLTNWLFPYKEDVGFLCNNCEASTFFNFLPAIVPIILLILGNFYKVDKNRKMLILVLFFYVLFQMSWGLVSYPVWFAKYSLFYHVTSRLFLLSTNLIGIYISIAVFSLILENPPFTRRGTLIISSLVMAFYFIAIRNTAMKQYLTILEIVITLAFLFALNYFYLKGVKKYLYTLLIILILVSGVTVNPLARGLSPIYDKVVSREILRIHNQHPDAKWAYAGVMFRANLFPALGVKSFNGYHLYPDMKMWRSLDPEGLYIDKYNRFYDAILLFTEKKTYFTAPYHDVLNVFLNGADLEKTGIRFLISSENLDNERYLEKLNYFEKDNIYFYKVITPDKTLLTKDAVKN